MTPEIQEDPEDRGFTQSLESASAALERADQLADEASGLIGNFLAMHEKNHYREKLRTIFRGGIRAA